ncbi:MAG: shikimate dehydrogenase [Nitrospinae bacterium]|nr:shikimate dehydrogenase [Nitrospinota bacterium]
MPDTVLGIIGYPVSHSLSPLMHNSAAKDLRLPFVYIAFEVPPASLAKAVAGMKTLGIAGMNVTVPHKEKIVPLLDALDKGAAEIGAVNTVKNNNGVLTGANTDGVGFLRALKAERFNPRGKRAVIIGAGGSSRAIGVSLCKAGAKEIVVINRSEGSGKALVRHLSRFGKADFHKSTSPAARDAVARADLVVQTTPAGMKKSDPLPLADPPFRKGQLVYDIIYSPGETRFLKAAKKAGANTLNGLSMLVYQGSESFKMWTGRRFPEEKVLRLLKKQLGGNR